jgi:hypothetical protein
MKYYFSRYQTPIIIVFFFIVAALLYLPLTDHFTYYDDDWYSMYAARVAGPEILQEFYILDSRPMRALVMIPLYILFQGHPFYYALSAYFFRVLGALTMLWALRLVWPAHKRETFLAALLFLVYPGFLNQTVPIDFQSHLIGIWLAYLSLGLSVKSIFISNRFQRLILWVGAAISGLLCIGLMEYYIGFEAARLLLFAVIFSRLAVDRKGKILAGFNAWVPYALIPLIFVFWRFFIFEGQRKVTDVGLQIGRVFAVPLHTMLTWALYFLQDIVNVTFLAWSVPFSQLGFNLRLRDSMIALGLSLLVLILFYGVLHLSRNDSDEDSQTPPSDFKTEGLWVGAIWVVAGLVFVILANRHVVFPEFSRYGFVSAGGAVIFLVALLSWVSSKQIQLGILGLLLLSATVTHYANAVKFASLADDIRAFWWQVNWRVPNFEPGTTLVAHYPNGGIRETSFVWGPANQIYFPDGLTQTPVQTGISSMLPNQSTMIDILNRKQQYSDLYYLVETYPDPRHVLVLTQPSPLSCLQVIDGDAPEYSSYEDAMFLSIGEYSDTKYINTQGDFPEMPEFLFGAEPEHGWCYYYQKASLARQQENWDEVIKLGLEISENGYRPDDLIEWMPFLQGYALSNNEESLKRLASAVKSDKFVAHQACEILSAMQGLEANIQSIIDSKYCTP